MQENIAKVLWCRVSWTRALVQIGQGSTARQSRVPLQKKTKGNLADTREGISPPGLTVTQHPHTPQELSPTFSSLSVPLVLHIPQSLSPMCKTPVLGGPVGGSTCSQPGVGEAAGNSPMQSPFSSQPTARGTDPIPIAFPPILHNYMYIFSTALFVQ